MISFFCLLILPSLTISFHNQPDGFRGHKWGSELESFEKMTLILGDPDVKAYREGADIKAYALSNDALSIDGVEVLLIAFYFYMDKFGMVTINYETKKNYEKLKNIFVSRYGSGSKNNPTYYDRFYEDFSGKKPPSFRKMHWWLGKQGYIRIEYNENMGRGTIIYDYWNVILKDDYEKGIIAYKRRDYKKAIKYFLKFADSGIGKKISSSAQGYLGYMYENGLGVDKDCVQAIFWYRKAAGLLNPFGQYRLGWMYDIGCGVEKDYNQAVELYRKAAGQGFAPAQYNMGSMYEHGLGVQKNIQRAKVWYQKASDQNYTLAKDALDRLKADQ